MNGPDSMLAPASVRPKRNLSWVGPALVMLFAALLMAGAATLVTEPDTVDRVQIVNRAEDVVDVDVKEPGGPWIPLAAVDPQGSTIVYDVVDAGGPWIVRFKVAEEVLATVQVSHARLERSNWRIAVPTLVN